MYEGWFLGGEPHGCGQYLCAKSGDFYVGMWREGVRHGQGFYVFSGGAEREGVWVDGKIAEGEERWAD